MNRARSRQMRSIRPALMLAFLFLVLPEAAFPQDQTQVGYGVLTQEQGITPAASALFRLEDAGGILLSEAAVPAGGLLRRARIFADERGPSTGVAFANPSGDSSVLSLQLRDDQGTLLAESELELGPGEHRALFLNQLFPKIAVTVGSLTFQVREGDPGVAAVTIRQTINQRGPLFATLPVVSLEEGAASAGAGAPQQVVLPHLGAGGMLTTQIILINPTPQQIKGHIRLVESSGAPLKASLGDNEASQFDFELPADGTWDALLTSSGDTVQGYALITSESASLPAATAIFQFRDGGGDLVSEAGVASIPATTRARLFVDTVGTQTGVAIASPGNSEINLLLRLLDRNGLEVGRVDQSIPAAGHLAIFVNQLFPDLPEDFTGILSIESPSPIVPVSLKLSQNRRHDLILTTLPIADLDHLESGTTLVFAQVGFGGGFSTRFILIDRLSGGSTLNLRLRDSDGESLAAPLLGSRRSELLLELVSGGATQLRGGSLAAPARIELDLFDPVSSELALNQGNQKVIRPLVIDTDDHPRDDFPLSFQSLDPTVATVDSLGRITALQPGFSTLTVQAGGLLATTTLAVAGIDSGIAGFGVQGLVLDLANRLYLANPQEQTVLIAENIEAMPDLFAGISRQPGFRDSERLNALFRSPSFLAIDQALDILYVSDADNHVIRSVETNRVSTFAGQPESPGSSDGERLTSSFNRPGGLALDLLGFLWVVDSGNHTIRRISPTGSVTTIAGAPGQPGFVDGQGEAARFDHPLGIALIPLPLQELLTGQGADGQAPLMEVLVADSGNGAVRRVREDGWVRTLDGPLNPAGWVAFGSSPAPVFESPFDVSVDPVGNVFVSESESQNVRSLLRNGELVPVAETGTFSQPRGLAVGSNGRVLVADQEGANLQVVYGGPEILGANQQPLSEIRVQAAPAGAEMPVNVNGRNFSSDTAVVLAGSQISGVAVQNTGSLSFSLPDLPSGRTTLTVQNRGGLAQIDFVIEPIPLEDLIPGGITTVAGGATFAGDGGPAVEASLQTPSDTVLDSLGNLFIADSSNDRIRRLDRLSGVITTIAGTGRPGDSGDGNLGTAATLGFPSGLSVASTGSVFVADTENRKIREITSDGRIRTVLDSTFLQDPRDVVVGPDGHLYVADAHQILRYDPVGETLESFAGTGQAGDSGDGGPALAAGLNSPRALAFDRSGALLVADSRNNKIRRIQSGIIATVAGTGSPGFSGDGGAATQAALDFPTGIAVAPNGDLFIVDDSNQRVRRVSAETGKIESYAGNGSIGFGGDGIPALESSFQFPLQAAVDGAGNLYVADSFNKRIRQIDTNGIITTVAGIGEFEDGAGGFSGDGGPAFAATLFSPEGLDFDEFGNLFIADSLNHRIRRVEAGGGTIETVAGDGFDGFGGDGDLATSASLNTPFDVTAGQAGFLYVADAFNNRIRQIDLMSGLIHTVAGNGSEGNSGDGGPALMASFRFPSAVVAKEDGTLFISDSQNHRIRMLDPDSGTIQAFAGDGLPRFGGDGGAAEEASLFTPSGLALDGEENFLYVADRDNNRVRRIDLATRTIETIAGNGSLDYFGDGDSALLAGLSRVFDVAVRNQQLYIATAFHNRVRRVDLESLIITTAAGNGQTQISRDGDLAIETGVDTPVGLAVDAEGNLFLSERNVHRIRAVRATQPD